MRSARIVESSRVGIVVDCYDGDGLVDIVQCATYDEALRVVMAWLRNISDYDDVATTCQRQLFDGYD